MTKNWSLQPSHIASAKLKGSVPERLICGYIVAIPFLWILGLTLPVGFAVIFGTFVLYARSRFAWSRALPWFLVAAMQFLSVLVNWYQSTQPWWMLGKHLFASYVSGWLLIGATVGIGASGEIRLRQISASILRLTLVTGILAILMYGCAAVSRADSLYLTTPLGYLIPANLPARQFSFGMFLFSRDSLFGIAMPRISIFYPWPNVLGIAGLATVFVMLGNEWRRRSVIAIVLGVFFVFASLGRLEISALFASILLWAFLALEIRVKIAALALVAAASLAVILFTGSLDSFTARAQDDFTQGRPGASQARDEVYRQSWEGIRRAPLLGHGWPGELISWDDTLSVYGTQSGAFVGTHSTVSGLIYKGGILTFAAFCFAFVTLILRDLAPYTNNSRLARNALAALGGFGLISLGEGLESVAFSLMFFFLWIGTVSRRLHDAAEVA